MKKPTSKNTAQSSEIRAGFSPRAVKTLQLATGESPSGGSETPTPPDKNCGPLGLKKATFKAAEKKGGVVRFKKKK